MASASASASASGSASELASDPGAALRRSSTRCPGGPPSSTRTPSPSPSRASTDALRLRRAARLVHCLQKERGASCALCALASTTPPSPLNGASSATESSTLDGGGGDAGEGDGMRPPPLSLDHDGADEAEADPPSAAAATTTTTEAMLSESVRRARRSADAAVSSLPRSRADVDVRAELSRIRAVVDLATSLNGSAGEGAAEETWEWKSKNKDGCGQGFPFHRVLAAFNELIASVTQESFVQACNVVWRSRNVFPPSLLVTGRVDDVADTLTLTMANSDNSASCIENDDGGSAECECERAVASSLLSILLSFVRLKESTGVERAVLSSLMAMGRRYRRFPAATLDESLHPPIVSNVDLLGGAGEGGGMAAAARAEQPPTASAVLFSDLVLEEENRRRIVRDLSDAARRGRRRRCLSATGVRGGAASAARRRRRCYDDDAHRSLLALVERAVEPDPDMEAAHNAVRMDFDLDRFRSAMSLDSFWAGITAYMERLHSMELLVIEELESCLEVIDSATAPARGNDDVVPVRVHAKTQVVIAKVAAEQDEQAQAAAANEINGIRISTSGNVGNIHCNEQKEPASACIGALLQALHSEGKPGDEAMEALAHAPAEELKASLLEMLHTRAKDAASASATASTSSSTSRASSPATSSSVSPSASPSLSIGLSEDVIPPLALPPAIASDPSLLDWAIDPYELRFLKRIGRGGAGTTYLAGWGGRRVAVKVATITDMGLGGWASEATALRRLHHPNVIRLLGCIYNPSPRTYGLVLEYCDSGDLAAALKGRTPPGFFWAVAGDVACGVAYLHSRRVLHRDIKPENVLLHGDVGAGEFTAKLTDFGVATMAKDESDNDHTAETGTFRWMAPEVVRHENYSHKADVYSYALVLWSLVTREEPFRGRGQVEAAGLVALEGARPPLPTGFPPTVADLVKRCWDENPEERPAFDAIRTELNRVRGVLSERDRQYLDAGFGHPAYRASLSSAGEVDIDEKKGEEEDVPPQKPRSKSETWVFGKASRERVENGIKPRRKSFASSKASNNKKSRGWLFRSKKKTCFGKQ